MYVCIHTYLYIYIHEYIMYIYIYIHTYLYMYIHIYIHMSILYYDYILVYAYHVYIYMYSFVLVLDRGSCSQRCCVVTEFCALMPVHRLQVGICSSCRQARSVNNFFLNKEKHRKYMYSFVIVLDRGRRPPRRRGRRAEQDGKA